MGCFSYLCKECGKGIRSAGVDGDECIIFLLSDGQAIEKMEGRYNSYGGVFEYKGKHEYFLHAKISSNPNTSERRDLNGSFEWKHSKWEHLIDMHFNKNPSDGFAAYHKECFDGVLPTTQSGDDPNQGWGEDRMIEIKIGFKQLRRQIKQLLESNFPDPDKEGLHNFLGEILDLGDELKEEGEIIVKIVKGTEK